MIQVVNAPARRRRARALDAERTEKSQEDGKSGKACSERDSGFQI